MSVDSSPGLPAPVEALWPDLTQDDVLRERLRQARIVAVLALAVALVLGTGWFLDRRTPDVDPGIRAEVDLILSSWLALQGHAAAQRPVSRADLSAARIWPEAPGVRDELETVTETREAPERYFVTDVRETAGGVVLVEAGWSVSRPDAAYSSEYFVTFVRGDDERLRMVQYTLDLRGGI
jgi:hypothetical protein